MTSGLVFCGIFYLIALCSASVIPIEIACEDDGVKLKLSTVDDSTFWVTKKMPVKGNAVLTGSTPQTSIKMGWAGGVAGNKEIFNCRDFKVKTNKVSRIDFYCRNASGDVIASDSRVVSPTSPFQVTTIADSFWGCHDVKVTFTRAPKAKKFEVKAMTMIACPGIVFCDPVYGAGVLEATPFFPGADWAEGSSVNFVCIDPFYELVGCPVMICQDDGEWSCDKPQCEPITCAPRPDNAGRTGLSLNITQGTLGDWTVNTCIEYFCDPPTSPLPGSYSCCLEDGNWTIPIPYCV